MHSNTLTGTEQKQLAPSSSPKNNKENVKSHENPKGEKFLRNLGLLG
jgi:hypothetical protein